MSFLVPIFNAVWKASQRRTAVTAGAVGEIED